MVVDLARVAVGRTETGRVWTVRLLDRHVGVELDEVERVGVGAQHLGQPQGDGDRVKTIADEWTFARNPKSRDPNWKLVATSQLE